MCVCVRWREVGVRTLLSLAACTLVHLGVGASVLLYVFVHACGEMIPRHRTRCSFERRGNWVTSLCKRWFLDALLYMHASKSNTHREDMRTRTSELNFGGWIVRAAKFSWNVANVQLDYNWIHKGNNLSRHVIMWFQAPEILPWQRLLFY